MVSKLSFDIFIDISFKNAASFIINNHKKNTNLGNRSSKKQFTKLNAAPTPVAHWYLHLE